MKEIMWLAPPLNRHGMYYFFFFFAFFLAFFFFAVFFLAFFFLVLQPHVLHIFVPPFCKPKHAKNNVLTYQIVSADGSEKVKDLIDRNLGLFFTSHLSLITYHFSLLTYHLSLIICEVIYPYRRSAYGGIIY